MLPYNDGRFFFAQFVRCQLCGRGPNGSQTIMPQFKYYSDRSWPHPRIWSTSFAQCYFWFAIWRRQPIHTSTSWIDSCSKVNFALIGAVLYLKVQTFSNVQYCLLIMQILQNIDKNHKIHLFYALVYFDKTGCCTSCGCVLLATGWLHFECSSLHIHKEQCSIWWRCHLRMGRASYAKCNSCWE